MSGESIDPGVPVDLTDDQGDTLLILAADHGHAETVAAPLERGVDHSRANDRARASAAFFEVPAMVELFDMR